MTSIAAAGGLPATFWLVFWPSVAVIGFFVIAGLLYRMRDWL